MITKYKYYLTVTPLTLDHLYALLPTRPPKKSLCTGFSLLWVVEGQLDHPIKDTQWGGDPTGKKMQSWPKTLLDLLVTSPAHDGGVHECLKMRTHSNGVPTPGMDTFLVLSKFANSPYSTSMNYQHIYVNRSETDWSLIIEWNRTCRWWKCQRLPTAFLTSAALQPLIW